MSIAALQSVLSAGPSPLPSAAGMTGADVTDFPELLRQETQARDAAMKLVSSSLVLPILTSMREGTFLEEPFKPGTMERRFGPLLDQAVADRITQSSNFDLVDSVVRTIQPQIDAGTMEVLA